MLRACLAVAVVAAAALGAVSAHPEHLTCETDTTTLLRIGQTIMYGKNHRGVATAGVSVTLADGIAEVKAPAGMFLAVRLMGGGFLEPLNGTQLVSTPDCQVQVYSPTTPAPPGGSYRMRVTHASADAYVVVAYTNYHEPGVSIISTRLGPAPASAPAPAPAPGPPAPSAGKVGHGSNIPLTGIHGLKNYFMDFHGVGDDAVNITVRLTGGHRAWVGLGFSADGAVSMNGNGAGSDIFYCSEGNQGVMRKWTTQFFVSGGVPVPGSFCEWSETGSTMSFVRPVAANGVQGRAVTPGRPQTIIFAHGADGELTVQDHGPNNGGIVVDFSKGSASGAAARHGELVLYLHFILMIIGWGALLPWGVTLAATTRSYGAKGAWFILHKRFQYVGWAVQIGGFVAAVVYCQRHSTHFANLHALLGLCVVSVGTLQPLNALIRPHPTNEHGEKTTARRIWEIVHKGLGWCAVIVGMLNIVIGILLIKSKGYDSLTIVPAVVLASLGILPVLGAMLLHFCSPEDHNPVALFCTSWAKSDDDGSSHDGHDFHSFSDVPEGP